MNRKPACLSVAFIGMLQAQEGPALPKVDLPLQLPSLAWEDTKAVVQAPAQWKASQWSAAALGVASVGLALALDGRVDEGVRNHRREGWDTFSKRVETLGGTGGLVLVGGIYGAGLLADQPELRALGADAGIAILISRVVFDLPLKTLAGRSRPVDGEGPRHFEPFGKEDSFPSGHATQAFAIATVIAAHTENYWVIGGAYGMATLVGLARVERRQHYLSDVVAGALLGTAVGRVVVRTNQRLRSGTPGTLKITFQPTFAPDFRGLAVSARF